MRKRFTLDLDLLNDVILPFYPPNRIPSGHWGFEDETCVRIPWEWSSLEAPTLPAWAEAERPLRLIEQALAEEDPETVYHNST